MPHIDPERLALLAMGEPDVSPEESDHLAECAECVDDLTALRHAVLAGRASFDVGELESPPDSVWESIASELSLASNQSDATAPEPVVVAAPVESAPVDSRPKTTRGIWRLWALAASFALIAAAGLGVWVLNQQPSQTEVAEASLAAFPSHSGAAGTAVVEEAPDGSLAVHVKLTADAAPDSFREVWLITADASALVSLGVLDGTQATFPVPPGVDLRNYVLVDISQEPVDGNPGHSGDSIVRGELTFL